jgi:hypothetical protein
MEKMTKMALKTTLLLPLLLLAATPALYGGSLDPSVIGMFPKNVGEFGCADLSRAREFPWFPQLQAQLVPVSLYEFEQFLGAAQLSQAPAIEEVAWARVSASDTDSDRAKALAGQAATVAVATGEFDADAIQMFLNASKIAFLQVGNHTLYNSGTGAGSQIYFTMVDWKTIAFGPLAQLERILRVHDGDEDNLLENEKMMTLIDRANGDGIFWGVLDSSRVGGVIGQLVPEAASFPQSRDLLGKMKELLIVARTSDDIELEFQTASDSKEDALLLSQLLQAGVLLRRYQTSNANNPQLAQLLDAARISAEGDALDVSFNLTNDQVSSLIEHNTFAK